MLRFLEILWLCIAIAAAMLMLFYSVTAGFGYDAKWFGIIAAVGLMMFFLRRKQRKSRNSD